MENCKQWYAVYTKVGQERKVGNLFKRKKIDSFYPSNKMSKSFYGKERVSYKPLIDRYVFVCLAEEDISKIKEINGVINLVYWLSKPVTISNDDMYLLRRFNDTYNDIQLKKTKINLSEPAFTSNEFSDNIETVSFTLPALGFIMTAQTSKTRVKVITVGGYQTKTKLFSKYAEAR